MARLPCYDLFAVVTVMNIYTYIDYCTDPQCVHMCYYYNFCKHTHLKYKKKTYKCACVCVCTERIYDGKKQKEQQQKQYKNKRNANNK